MVDPRAVLLRQTDHYVVIVVALAVLADLDAVDGRLDRPGHRGGAQVHQGRPLTIDDDAQLRLARIVIVGQVGDARNVLDYCFNLLGQGNQDVELVAADFDLHGLARRRARFVDHYADVCAWKIADLAANLFDGVLRLHLAVHEVQELDGDDGHVRIDASAAAEDVAAAGPDVGRYVLDVVRPGGALEGLPAADLLGNHLAHRVGHLQRRADRHGDIDPRRLRSALGEEFDLVVEDLEGGHRADEQHKAGDHDPRPAARTNGRRQQPLVDQENPPADPLVGTDLWCRGGLALHFQQDRAERRVDDHGHQQRGRQGDDDRLGQKAHELADDVRPEQQRDECRQGREGRSDHRPGYLAGAIDGRLDSPRAFLHVAVHVLDDDDGVVDQHAEHQYEAEQHDHVQRDAQGAQDGEGNEHRERNRQRYQNAVAHSHDDHHDNDDQNQAGQHVVLQVGDHQPDELRLVERHVDVNRLRQSPLVALDNLEDLIGDRDDVRPGPLDHREGDALAAVKARVGLTVLEGVADTGHVAEVDGLALPLVDNQVVDLARFGELALHPGRVLGRRHVERAAGDVLVLGGDARK